MLYLKEVDGKFYHVDAKGEFVLDGEGNKKVATAEEVKQFQKKGDDDKGDSKKVDLAKVDLDTLAESNPAVAKLIADAKNAAEALEAKTKAEQEAEAEALKSKGEFEQLYQGALGEVEKYKGEATKHSETLEKYKGTINTILEQVVADIPEDRVGLIPTDFSPRKKLEYITKNSAALGVKHSPISRGGDIPPNDKDMPTDDKSKLHARFVELQGKESLTPEEGQEFLNTAKEIKKINKQPND